MHKAMHSTSTNMFGSIIARMMPTATQNRANPTTRFIIIATPALVL